METVLLIVALVTGVVSGFSRTAPLPQSKMHTFQLVLLKKGTQPLDQKTLQAHGAFVTRLGDDGKALVAGPFTDGGDIVGAIMLRAATADEARTIQAEDPAVKAGLFTMEILPFMSTDEGQFKAWEKPFAQETVYFGFLNSGPNRSQSKEEAQELQKQHIAFMNGQAEQGKLIVAGPFVDGGTRRGIVVYREASLETAKARAEQDPMVKVDRLAVELHPWRVPKGALK